MTAASRSEADGDMAGAWGWYRAVLRGSRLLGRHSVIIARLVGNSEYAAARNKIASWAADPRVDARLLRVALDDVLEALEANVVLPLENTEVAEELNLKPKRGVLLAGPPGTGPSLSTGLAARASCSR